MKSKVSLFLSFLKSLPVCIFLFGISVYAHNELDDESDRKEFVAALERGELPAFQGDCDKDYVEVLYDDSLDYEMACEGIQKAEIFSENHLKYKIEKPIKILFGDATILHRSGSGVSEIPSLAVYEHRENVIVIQPWATQKNNKIFELPFTESLLVSLVVHEVIHRIHYARFQELLANDVDFKFKKWEEILIPTEFLSHIAQIEMMDEKEKEQVLSLTETGYLEKEDINPHTYIYAPNLFAVRSYKLWEEDPDFLDSVFNVTWNISIIANSEFYY